MKKSVPVYAVMTLVFLFPLAPLRAQKDREPEEVKVDDMEATPYGVNITLRATKSDDVLNMLIGLTEGEAIVRALQHQSPSRPLTHDLMKTILDRTGWRVQRVLIRAINGTNNYLADLVLEKDGEIETIDARPSDAMAIAVRSNAKIYVSQTVFDEQRSRQEQANPEPEPAPPKEKATHL